MTDMEKLQQWLQTFPGWSGVLTVDWLENKPDAAGLYPKGLREVSRKEDVLGNLRLRCRYTFGLRREVSPGQDNALWLLELQNWVQTQSALGLVPRIGEEDVVIRAYDGKLSHRTGLGSEHYTVMLTVEFTKIFRGE